MLRLSGYTIFVDLSADEVLLVHGYSGAWDLVSRSAATALRQYRSGPVFQPLIGRPFSEKESVPAVAPDPLSDAAIDQLVRRGFLTRLTAEEEQQRVAALATNLHDAARYETPSYVLALTYDCNLRCGYCFQDSLRSNPANAPRLITMSTAYVFSLRRPLGLVAATGQW